MPSPRSPTPTSPTSSGVAMVVLIDDRLLIEHLLVGLSVAPQRRLMTTSLWYHRACRAAVAGGAGQLSGPFTRLDALRQAAAIRQLLTLPDEVVLPDPRRVVPAMAELSERHPHGRLLDLEAAAVAVVTDAEVLLSPAGARGVLPAVLDAEGRTWSIHGVR